LLLEAPISRIVDDCGSFACLFSTTKNRYSESTKPNQASTKVNMLMEWTREC
jgi:hypothetical protein